jgi:hypothetical protein
MTLIQPKLGKQRYLKLHVNIIFNDLQSYIEVFRPLNNQIGIRFDNEISNQFHNHPNILR